MDWNLLVCDVHTSEVGLLASIPVFSPKLATLPSRSRDGKV